MNIRNLALISILLTATLAQAQSCGRDQEVKKIFTLDSKVELIFFFRKDIQREERDKFYENALNRPVAGGYWPRDGVKSTFGIDRDGYEGFGITFQEDATKEQKDEIKKLLKESPLIHKVYENVIPNQIGDL